jgi:hypothetical protein
MITPEIDDDAIETFTRGQCHALALALHEETKFPLVGLWSDGWETRGTPCHVVVRMPKGTLLDIAGPGAEDRWEGTARKLSKAVVEDLCNKDYSTPRMDEARPYAKAVLRDHGIRPFKTKKRRA